MPKKTKAELEQENEFLRDLAGNANVISDCIFNGPATDKQCEAVIEIAKALREASKALYGAPAIHLGTTEKP